MRLYDLHADTAVRLYHDKLRFTDSCLALSAADLTAWEDITQVFAVFSRPKYSDEESYRIFFRVRRHLLRVCRAYKATLRPILSVEDARLLCGVRERLQVLYRHGVDLLTPVWRGETVIGGAYDTNAGLTEFGKTVIADCFSLGIIPDVSHASQRTFSEIAEKADEAAAPMIASHSCSYAVCGHPRNLTDAQFEVIRRQGGLVGLCFCPQHLSDKGTASDDDVLRHLEHWLSLGGECAVAFGSDFDGTDALPAGLTRNRGLLDLAEKMARIGYNDELIDRHYYKNAEAFFEKNLKNRKDRNKK